MLTQSCPRKVRLTIEGKQKTEATTALVRGLMAGEALRMLHITGIWEKAATLDGCAEEFAVNAQMVTEAQLLDEGRAMTDAVVQGMPAILQEVAACTRNYAHRFGPRMERCELIGTEVPVRMDARGVRFASHLDLLLHDPRGVLHGVKNAIVCWDWKYREEAPTRAFLARNLQLGLYWYMLIHGEALVSPELQVWDTPAAKKPCIVAWCHLTHLKVFGRATTYKDDAGNEHAAKKGDSRPDSFVIREPGFRRRHAERVLDDIMQHVALMRSGIDIAIPDPVGCHLCECEPWCHRHDSAPIDGEAD